MSTPDLDAIRQREQAATDGPWAACEMTNYGRSGTGFWSVQPVNCTGEPDDTMSESDAEFIAHARTDIPLLLNELDRLRAALLALRDEMREDADECQFFAERLTALLETP